jgi:hypothetical protein
MLPLSTAASVFFFSSQTWLSTRILRPLKMTAPRPSELFVELPSLLFLTNLLQMLFFPVTKRVHDEGRVAVRSGMKSASRDYLQPEE